MKNFKIIRKIKNTKIWPGVSAVEAEVNFGSGVSRICNIRKAEFELLLYIQNNPISKELEQLIDNYAEEKYDAGSLDESMSNADESL